MKRLNKGKIHPSSSPPSNADHITLLPAAIITLAAALSPQDKEVLAYLISCSSNSTTTTAPNNPKSATKFSRSSGNHEAEFTCDCFRCYMSYWVRWDASPNRQLIHEILEAYDDGVFDKKVMKSKKDSRRKRVPDVAPAAADDRGGAVELGMVEMVLDNEERSIGDGEIRDCDQSGLPCTVRKLVSFMGERIWGVWGII